MRYQRRQQRRAIQQCPHVLRRSVTVLSDDTWRTEMRYVFPGPQQLRTLLLYTCLDHRRSLNTSYDASVTCVSLDRQKANRTTADSAVR